MRGKEPRRNCHVVRVKAGIRELNRLATRVLIASPRDANKAANEPPRVPSPFPITTNNSPKKPIPRKNHCNTVSLSFKKITAKGATMIAWLFPRILAMAEPSVGTLPNMPHNAKEVPVSALTRSHGQVSRGGLTQPWRADKINSTNPARSARLAASVSGPLSLEVNLIVT